MKIASLLRTVFKLNVLKTTFHSIRCIVWLAVTKHHCTWGEAGRSRWCSLLPVYTQISFLLLRSGCHPHPLAHWRHGKTGFNRTCQIGHTYIHVFKMRRSEPGAWSWSAKVFSAEGTDIRVNARIQGPSRLLLISDVGGFNAAADLCKLQNKINMCETN